MYYSYVEIEYVATSFSPLGMDLALKLLIILDYIRPVSIVGYDESLGSKTYQTVSGVVAYDDPQTGRMLHLIIN